MEPERRYTQEVKKSFHISMAALDISTSGDEPAQVMCGFEGRNYLICTLKKPDVVQCALDLEFACGSQVSFASNGNAHIHLTGYLTDIDDDGLNLTDLEEQEEEENDEVEEMVEKKRTKKNKLKNKDKEVEPPAKKTKLLNGSVNEEVEESDDPDFEGESEEEAENEESGEEDSVDETEEDEEEGGEEEESGAEEEVEVPQKLSKKERKLLKKLQEQQQQNGDQKKNKKEQPQQEKKKQKKILDKGVVVEDLVEGNGPSAKPGKFVNVYYEGRLEKTNKMFDSTNKGPGFKFRLGSGEVIKAWDIGLVGMKVGGKRKITCPPHTAYGAKGSPPAIPPNSTLVFTVELKKLN